ncbi:MAG TPA: hypothetical protein VJ741_05790 [Solirubrobacteraceae bacterium]|nr:hypothetical protein [Solirubrobacteraceae bacterium]
MEIATLVFAALAAIGTVFVPFYLATPRLSLRFIGFEVLGWQDIGHASVLLRLAVHNKGHGAINALEVRAALPGQALLSAPVIVRFAPLEADQYEVFDFTPDPQARFVLGEDPHLVTPIVIAAQWGGKVRKTLQLSGSLMRLMKRRDHRPRGERRFLGVSSRWGWAPAGAWLFVLIVFFLAIWSGFHH